MTFDKLQNTKKKLALYFAHLILSLYLLFTSASASEFTITKIAKPIKFNNLDKQDMSSVAFYEIDTVNFPPVSHEEFFGRVTPHQSKFTEMLKALFEENGFEQRFLIFNSKQSGSTFEYYGVLYQKDFTVVPITFKPSKNFDAWAAAFSDYMDSPQLTLRVQSDFTGMSYSRPLTSTNTMAIDPWLVAREYAPDSFKEK